MRIHGYRLYLVEEWLDDSPFLFSSVVVRTNRNSDTILVNVLRMTASSTPDQHRLAQDNFISPQFAGLSAQSVDSNGNKLGDMVVCDPDKFRRRGQPLQLIEVVQGALQGDIVNNVKLNLALRLFNCLSASSRISSAAPSAELAERFEQMFRIYLQGGKTGGEMNFRSMVRRLVRRVNGALTNLLYRSGETDSQGVVVGDFLTTLERYRADQHHQTIGITPEVLRKMRSQVELLARRMDSHGYSTPTDPWIDYSRMHSAVTGMCSHFGLFPDRASFESLVEMLEKEPILSNNSSDYQSAVLPSEEYIPVSTNRIGELSPRDSAVNPLGVSRTIQGIGQDKLIQLKEATEVLDSVISNQREEINRAQASYDALYERYMGVTTKMYESLQELNAYKLRVEELEGRYKQLDYNWSTTTEAIRDYNDTFAHFESRVLRLDEHVNNMYRQSKSIFTRLGFFLLTWIVYLLGTLFGYGVSFVYLFRRGNSSNEEKALLQKRVAKEFAGVLKAVDPDLEDSKVRKNE